MAMDLERTRSEVVVEKLGKEDRMLLATDMDRMLGGVLDQLKLVMGKLQVFEPLFEPVSYGLSHLHNTHSGCETICSRRCLQVLFYSVVPRPLTYAARTTNRRPDLIHQFFKNPIQSADGTNFTNTEVGIPQGSVLSPILMNIVLHELDLFATELIKGRGIYYGRYAYDVSIGTRANSDEAAWEVVNVMQTFIRTELKGLELRAKPENGAYY